GLPMDDEGLLPDALDAACRTDRARLLFVNPTAHNPTTATMSPARREAIAALARTHDLIVIEDDVYGRLPERRPPPLAALAPQRTVYIGSAAKTVASGPPPGEPRWPPSAPCTTAAPRRAWRPTCASARCTARRICCRRSPTPSTTCS